MQEVKFSDLRNAQSKLVKNASLFEDKKYPKLKEFLKLDLKDVPVKKECTIFGKQKCTTRNIKNFVKNKEREVICC